MANVTVKSQTGRRVSSAGQSATFFLNAVIILISFNTGDASTARATTLVQKSFGEVCRQADVVFVGTVTHIESRTSDEGGFIYTHTRFQVDRWISGLRRAETYEIRTMGGRIGDEAFMVHGLPTFESGQRYVLFVREGSRSICPVVGWHQGCFRVLNRLDRSDPIVTDWDGRGVTGIHGGSMRTRPAHATGQPDVVDPSVDPGSRDHGASSIAESPDMPLDEFIRIIQVMREDFARGPNAHQSP